MFFIFINSFFANNKSPIIKNNKFTIINNIIYYNSIKSKYIIYSIFAFKIYGIIANINIIYTIIIIFNIFFFKIV